MPWHESSDRSRTVALTLWGEVAHFGGTAAGARREPESVRDLHKKGPDSRFAEFSMALLPDGSLKGSARP
jgi:hypothetical protein